MSSCGLLRPFAIFARRKWRKVYFWSIDHYIWCCPCCWARCWMLQDMDHMEASCVFYVKVGRFNESEQSKISILTVTSLGIVMVTIHYDLMVSVWFMKDPGDVLQTNITRRSFRRRMSFLYLWNMRYQLWFIKMYPSEQTNYIGLTYPNCRTVGIPCSYMQCSYTQCIYLQQDSAAMECVIWLSLIPFLLVANYIIFRTSHIFLWSSSSSLHTTKSWLQKHFNKVRLEQNQTKPQVVHTMGHLVRSSSNADNS